MCMLTNTVHTQICTFCIEVCIILYDYINVFHLIELLLFTLQQSLSQQFGVAGIPTLILLDENGAVLNKNARMDVLDDPEGEDFPWKK